MDGDGLPDHKEINNSGDLTTPSEYQDPLEFRDIGALLVANGSQPSLKKVFLLGLFLHLGEGEQGETGR